MAYSMRDWIGRLVESELNDALACFEGTYIPGQKAEDRHRSCGPDTVTVQIKKGREVQIIEINGRGVDPFEATVSDGKTHIRATFDRVATDLFAKKNSRDLLDILGGVIALVDFRVTFNRKSKAPTTLILEVLEFKLRGSEGSGPFGRPADVYENKNVQMVLERLEGLLDGNGYECDIRSQPPSPIRPQKDDVSNRGSRLLADSTSQEAFGTQVPDKVHKRPANQVSAKNSNTGNLAFLLGRLSRNALPSNQNDRKTTNDTLPEQAPTAGNDLQKKSVLTPVSSDRILEMTSKLEAKANEQQSQSPLSARTQASDPKSQPIFVKDPNPEDMPVPVSDDSEKENSQESLKSRRSIMNRPKSEPIHQAKTEAATVQMSIVDQFQNGNPFQGLKRVPRRYIRIPESQQCLLERKDSWYVPQADSRSIYAIIPAKVRDNLATFMERKSASRRLSEGSPESQVDSDDSDDDQQSRHDTGIYETKPFEGEGEEQSLNIMEEENSGKEPPWIRLERPQAEANTTPRSDRGGNLATHRNDQQRMIFSSSMPDVLTEEIDEAGQTEGENISDEEPVSWASTPEQGLREMGRTIESSNNPRSSNSSRGGTPGLSGCVRHTLNPLLTRHGIDRHSAAGVASQFSEPDSSLPTRYENNTDRQNSQSTRGSRAPVPITASSPVEEEELEFVIPYAVGDLVEENDFAGEDSSTFQKHPSTALQDPKQVQVEQTPFPKCRRLDGRLPRSGQDEDILKESKRDDVIISSDPRIPATCDNAHSEKTISASREKEAPIPQQNSGMTTLTVEYQSDEPQQTSHMHDQSSLEKEEEEDDLAQKQLFFEHESSLRDPVSLSSTRVQATISLDVRESPKRPNLGEQVGTATPPRNLQTGHHVSLQLSSPLGTPISNKGQSDGSSPATISSLKSDRDVFGESPRNSNKKRRRVPMAGMIMEEEYPARDPKERARINRHNFNDRLSLATSANPPIMAMNTLPISPRSKEVIPSTNPMIKSVESLLQEPPFPSSTDGVEHVPATFEAPGSMSGSLALQDVGTPTQTKEISYSPAGASSVQELEANGFLDGEEEDAILNGSCLPVSEPETHSQLDFYDEFIHAYPKYSGSKNAFTWALVYIEWLREAKQFLHRALCDDFIRILSSDFQEYARESKSLTGKVAMNGWDFFHAKNEDPVFKYEVITPENLQDALASLHAEQVTKYRKEFAKDLKTADQQRSALQPLTAAPTQSLSTMEYPKAPLIEDASSDDLAFDDRASRSKGREPSPELESANKSNISGSAYSTPRKSAALSNGRQASPELGSVRGSSSGSIHHLIKEPYFETYSQLPTTKRKIETMNSRPSADGDLVSKSRESVPLEKEASSQSSNARYPRMEHESSASITSAQRNRGRIPSAEHRKANSSKRKSRPSPAPPILGSVSESYARPVKRPRTNSSGSPSRDPDCFEPSSLPASKVSSLSRTNLLKETVNDPGKVERWLMPSFDEFIQRRKSAGTLTSRFSKPNSTPNKRFCTKPAKVSPELIEPETQGWGY